MKGILESSSSIGSNCETSTLAGATAVRLWFRAAPLIRFDILNSVEMSIRKDDLCTCGLLSTPAGVLNGVQVYCSTHSSTWSSNVCLPLKCMRIYLSCMNEKTMRSRILIRRTWRHPSSRPSQGRSLMKCMYDCKFVEQNWANLTPNELCCLEQNWIKLHSLRETFSDSFP